MDPITRIDGRQAFQDAVERDRADGPVRLEAAADRKPGADEDSAPVLKQQLPRTGAVPGRDGPADAVHPAGAVGEDDVLDLVEKRVHQCEGL